MDLRYSQADERFRAELRSWLAEAVPAYGPAPPVHDWLEAWAEHNGCDPTPSESQPFDNVSGESWTGCAGGASVVLYTLEGGGHIWPGAPAGMTSGASFPYMDATDVIWEFFASHSKAPEG